MPRSRCSGLLKVLAMCPTYTWVDCARLTMTLTLILSLSEAVDFLDLGARASKKVEHWRARLCGKQRKSTASGQGEGSERITARYFVSRFRRRCGRPAGSPRLRW